MDIGMNTSQELVKEGARGVPAPIIEVQPPPPDRGWITFEA